MIKAKNATEKYEKELINKREIFEEEADMLQDTITSSRVFLTGRIEEDLEPINSKLYRGKLIVTRKSGTTDHLPIIIQKRFLPIEGTSIGGEIVEITGEMESRNTMKEDGSSKLDVFVFVKSIDILNYAAAKYETNNEIFMNAYLCKKQTKRLTPGGRKIIDFILAVNSPWTRKGYYLPCISWGGLANYVGNLPIGTHMFCKGRFQSRIYEKRMEDYSYEVREAYELSIQNLRVLEE